MSFGPKPTLEERFVLSDPHWVSLAGDSTHFCFSRSLFGITSSGVHVSCHQNNNIRSWTKICPGHRSLVCIPSGHCITLVSHHPPGPQKGCQKRHS